MIRQVATKGAADAAVLHRDHLVALKHGRGVDQRLVDVQFCHIIDDHCTLEGIVSIVLRLQNMLEKRRFACAQKSAEGGDRQLVHGRSLSAAAHGPSVILQRDGRWSWATEPHGHGDVVFYRFKTFHPPIIVINLALSSCGA